MEKTQAAIVWREAMASKGFAAVAAFHGAPGDAFTPQGADRAAAFLRDVAEALAPSAAPGVGSPA